MPESSGSLPKSHVPILRKVSAVALALAFSAAVLLIVLRLVHLLRPDFIRWNFKSAVPLMLVGTAFAFLQLAVPRTRLQILLGLSVSAAFVLWGIEQFISNPLIASSIDDLVVFLFVFDLSLVIYQQLKSNDLAGSTDLPFTVPQNDERQP